MKKLRMVLMVLILLAVTLHMQLAGAVSDVPDETEEESVTTTPPEQQEEEPGEGQSGFRIDGGTLQERASEEGNYLYGLESDVWGSKGGDITKRIEDYEEQQDQKLWDSLFEGYHGPPTAKYSDVLQDEDMDAVLESPQLHLGTDTEEQSGIVNTLLIIALFAFLAVVTYFATLQIRKLIKRKKKA